MRKRVLSFLLASTMIVGLLAIQTTPALAATSKTQAEAVAWAEAQIGKYLDYDGAYGSQCVDLVFYYYVYLGKSVSWGNGSDFTHNTLPSGWSRITYTKGMIP